jgi:hypothetical protein
MSFLIVRAGRRIGEPDLVRTILPVRYSACHARSLKGLGSRLNRGTSIAKLPLVRCRGALQGAIIMDLITRRDSASASMRSTTRKSTVTGKRSPTRMALFTRHNCSAITSHSSTKHSFAGTGTNSAGEVRVLGLFISNPTSRTSVATSTTQPFKCIGSSQDRAWISALLLEPFRFGRLAYRN